MAGPGRVINSLFLIQENLLTLPILYLSRYIIRHRADTIGCCSKVTREASWEEWLLYILAGVEDTARWTTGKIEAIRQLAVHTAEYVPRRCPRFIAMSWSSWSLSNRIAGFKT